MTLVGAGELGKTRTSLRVAARLLEEWRDGAAAEAAREVICERAPSDLDFHTIVANAMEHLALVYALCETFESAARLAGYANAAPHPLGFVRTATETITRDRLLALLRENVSSDDLTALFVEGEALRNDAAAGVALESPCRLLEVSFRPRALPKP